MLLFLIILFILGIFFLAFTFNEEKPSMFALGVICSALLSIVYYSISINSKPTPIDVYRGNTELKITSVNGIPNDTVVVFKNN